MPDNLPRRDRYRVHVYPVFRVSVDIIDNSIPGMPLHSIANLAAERVMRKLNELPHRTAEVGSLRLTYADEVNDTCVVDILQNDSGELLQDYDVRLSRELPQFYREDVLRGKESSREESSQADCQDPPL